MTVTVTVTDRQTDRQTDTDYRHRLQSQTTDTDYRHRLQTLDMVHGHWPNVTLSVFEVPTPNLACYGRIGCRRQKKV